VRAENVHRHRLLRTSTLSGRSFASAAPAMAASAILQYCRVSQMVLPARKKSSQHDENITNRLSMLDIIMAHRAFFLVLLWCMFFRSMKNAQ
jgi:hypothetical protein